MFKNLIIGAGQQGSRHLQGLLKFNREQIIYVLNKLKKDNIRIDILINNAAINPK